MTNSYLLINTCSHHALGPAYETLFKTQPCVIRLQRMTERDIEKVQNSLRLNGRNKRYDMVAQGKDIGIDPNGLDNADLMQIQITRCDFSKPTLSPSADHSSSSDESEDEEGALYCLCHRAAYGKMIRCDNSLCDGKWFHFPCVSLSDAPKGMWLCPNCKQ